MEKTNLKISFDEKNNISEAIWILGYVIIILGIVGSFICGKVFETSHGFYHTYYEYNWTVAISGCFGSVLIGMFNLALSTIIDYMEIIANSKIITTDANEVEKKKKESEVTKDNSIEDKSINPENPSL